MQTLRAILIFVLIEWSLSAGGVLEGDVELRPAKSSQATRGRYFLTGGKVEQPDLPRAVVYLEGAGVSATHSPGTLEVGQEGFQFRPGLLPVQKGTRIVFPNRDPDYHHVFSFSKAKRFNLGRYLKGETPPPIVLDQPGLVRLFCEIHAHMRGAILVLDTPYFTMSDTNGQYRLENIPPGEYVARAWVDEKDIRSAPVTIEEGKSAVLDFALPE